MRVRIFEQFVKAKPSGEYPPELEGLGMGLFLAKSILQRHGGAIWYEAERDGSKFVVDLPSAS